MDHRDRVKETEQVVKRVMKTVRKYDRIGNAEFEIILGQVMDEVHGSTGIEEAQITGVTDKVISDMPCEYGQISEEQRSREAMTGYL